MRNYKKEYENYHKRPEQKLRRAARNAARRSVDAPKGKDVHHKDNNPMNNDKKNLSNHSIFSIQIPRKEKKLPRPISEGNATKLITLASENNIKPWLAARNTAVISLLYGCGLRISEALNIKRKSYPFGGFIRIVGKGDKERITIAFDLMTRKDHINDNYISLINN